MSSKYDSLKINKLKLNDELSNQASHFATSAEESEILHNELQRLELQMEILGDEFYGKVREKYKNVNPKLKPNETAMKTMIRNEPKIKELREEIRKVGHAYRLARIKVEALKMKAEMLVSMAHNVRQERRSSEKLKT